MQLCRYESDLRVIIGTFLAAFLSKVNAPSEGLAKLGRLSLHLIMAIRELLAYGKCRILTIAV
jgi:hypothetical protein